MLVGDQQKGGGRVNPIRYRMTVSNWYGQEDGITSEYGVVQCYEDKVGDSCVYWLLVALE